MIPWGFLNGYLSRAHNNKPIRYPFGRVVNFFLNPVETPTSIRIFRNCTKDVDLMTSCVGVSVSIAMHKILASPMWCLAYVSFHFKVSIIVIYLRFIQVSVVIIKILSVFFPSSFPLVTSRVNLVNMISLAGVKKKEKIHPVNAFAY